MASRLQSYVIISKVVSEAYGKNVSKRKMQTATNQHIMNNHAFLPMEIFIEGMERRGYGALSYDL